MNSCPDTDNDPAMDCLFDMDNFHKKFISQRGNFFCYVSVID